jgi:hypothetical protein
MKIDTSVETKAATYGSQDHVSHKSYRFHTDRFNHKKLNMVEGKEQYCDEISTRFAALENLDNEVDNISAWETIRENTNISESLG